MRAHRLALPAVLLLALIGSAAAPASAGPSTAAKDAALLNALKTRRLTNVIFKDQGFKVILPWLRAATGWNFLLKSVEIQKAGIAVDDLVFDVELHDVTVAAFLQVLLEPHGLAVKVSDNIVFITTKGDAYGKPVTRVWGISHITWTKTDFIAPDINLHPSGYSPPEEYEPEVIVEDDPLKTGDAVADLVKELVAPGEWDTEGWSIRATNVHLVVRAPLAIQAQVGRAIDVIASMK
jgi:hypothetical protein